MIIVDDRHLKEAEKHCDFDHDSLRETFFIKLNDPLGGNLIQGNRCYFGYASRRYRRITGIELQTRNINGSWDWANYGQIPRYSTLTAVLLNIVGRNGKLLLENFPLARLSSLVAPIWGYNNGGKIVRFDLDADLQASYLTYVNPTPIGGGYTVPLTFSFDE